MNKSTKILTAALAALALVIGSLGATGNAFAGGGKGGGHHGHHHHGHHHHGHGHGHGIVIISSECGYKWVLAPGGVLVKRWICG